MKQSRLSQIFLLLLLFSILAASTLSVCPQEFTDETYYTNAKERYVVSLKEPEQSTNQIELHYSYLRDCSSRILINSTEYDYHAIVNNTMISENQKVIYIINSFNIYFGWFDPSYVNDKLSKMEVVSSAEKDQEVSINK